MTEKKTEFTHADMANAFNIEGLTSSEEEKLEKLIAKKKAAEKKRKDFYAEVAKHKDEVLRALGIDENAKTEITEEDQLKLQIADAAIEWGAQKGYSPEDLLVKFPEWVEKNRPKQEGYSNQ